MTEPIDPLRAVRGPPRRTGRERRAVTDEHGHPANLPAVREDEPEATSPPPGPKTSAETASAFAAQLLGQPERKRGLRGGPPVLEAAKAAYKKTEYSGPADRRPPAGRVARTEI